MPFGQASAQPRTYGQRQNGNVPAAPNTNPNGIAQLMRFINTGSGNISIPLSNRIDYQVATNGFKPLPITSMSRPLCRTWKPKA